MLRCLWVHSRLALPSLATFQLIACPHPFFQLVQFDFPHDISLGIDQDQAGIRLYPVVGGDGAKRLRLASFEGTAKSPRL